MRGKPILLAVLIWAVQAQIGYAALVAHWPFNNSPNDQVGALHWTLNGGAAYSADCKEGTHSLQCDGVNDYAGLAGSGLMSAVFSTKTILLWFKPNSTTGTQVLYDEGGSTQGIAIRINNGVLEAAVRASSVTSSVSTPLSSTRWSHVAISFDNGAFKLYLNGRQVASATASFTSVPSHTNVSGLGARNGQDAFGGSATGDYFGGLIDDVQMHNQVLTPAEIQRLCPNLALAVNVGPTNGAVDVPRNATLNWTPGETAGAHDVYLGPTFADVNTASRTDAKGTLASQGQTETSYSPAHALAYGQTYYWRVDEMNKTPDNTIFKGDVWSFTVEPYAYPIKPIAATASSSQPDMGPEKTIDGSGLTGDLHGTEPTTMWLSAGVGSSWIQYEFDKVYKLHQLMVWNSNQLIEAVLGFGSKNVTVEYSTDGKTWVLVNNVPDFAKAPGSAGYAANTTVSLGGALAKYVKLTINTSWGGMAATGLSEVRFFYTPLQARAPQPATAATGVSLDATLDWRPGREAASHKVYFGTDPNAVAQGTAAAKTKTDHSYTPDSLNLGTNYYWRVDEVNTVTYPGEVWSFTTQQYKVLDDFESYTDKPGEEVFSTWIDGFADNYQSSGSTVGLATAKNGTFCETTIFHGGKQSMPLAYDNTKTRNYSEAVLTFNTPQDWTANGIKSLSLWFQGLTGNGGQLYVKINSAKIAYDGEAADLARTTWLVWNIDLSKAGKVNSVRSLTIGIEGPGAKGTLYFDDIRLYPKTPEYITPIQPPATNLVAYYTFDEATGTKVGDSSGKGNHGTTNGKVQWGAGKIGGAMQFDGSSGYVTIAFSESLRVLNRGSGFTLTAWFNARAVPTENKMIFQQGDLTGTGRTWLLVHSANEVRSSLGNVATQTGYAIEANAWYHAAVVVKEGGTADTVQIYVDGRPAGAATTRNVEDSEGNFYIGCHKALTNFWDGLLDDVRIYNQPLSDAEVAGLAGQTKPMHKPF